MAYRTAKNMYDEGNRPRKYVEGTSTELAKLNFAPATFDSGNKGSGLALSNNDLTVTMTSGSWDTVYSTTGLSSGKYYCEFTYDNDTDEVMIGIGGSGVNTGNYLGSYATGYAYYDQTGQNWNSNSGTPYGNTFTTGDIIGMAVDFDNRYIYFSKNGVWQTSGDPTSGASGTGAARQFTAGTYKAGVSLDGGSSPAVTANFGATPFTYSVPAGYTAGWGVEG